MYMTTAGAVVAAAGTTTTTDQRRMSTVNISSNSLVQSQTTTKFTCETTYVSLIAMETPRIQFGTQMTEPEPEETGRRGIFSIIWNFLRTLFQRSVWNASSSFALLSNDVIALRNRTLFFGTEQVTSVNQNPIMAMFDTDSQQLVWCYNTYETAGADGRAIGALHALLSSAVGNDEALYIVLTIDGTQGTSAEDVRRFTNDGWIPSYGNGGGSKVSVVAQINTTTGAPITGTFLKSQLPSTGKTNSLVVTQLAYERNCNGSMAPTDGASFQLRIQAEAYYLPMSADGSTPLNETDCYPDRDSPFNYTVTLPPSLTEAYTADCRIIDNIVSQTTTC